MAHKNLHPVPAELESVQPLSDKELAKAERLGWTPAFIGSDGEFHVCRAGAGNIKFYLFPGGRFLPGIVDKSADQDVPVVRPLVFENVRFSIIDSRFIEVITPEGSQVVAADRFCRRLAARVPRVTRVRLGKPIVLAAETAAAAAREVRVREQ